mmetsp:Transcript_6547/g.14922  ORF Transcript_6547/g.14922 Transcript_6547/m.14922 type:complete len:201 (+) Transcript_6547:1076-1678(+)
MQIHRSLAPMCGVTPEPNASRRKQVCKASVALFTTSNHFFSPPWYFSPPVLKSIHFLMWPTQCPAFCGPASSSRTSISWSPSQFRPLPSLLFDQMASRPETALCSSRNAGLVLTRASAMRDLGWNFALRTASIAFQLLRKPAYEGSGCWMSDLLLRKASSPEQLWKSSMWSQYLMAWKAASALRKYRSRASHGAVITKPS